MEARMKRLSKLIPEDVVITKENKETEFKKKFNKEFNPSYKESE